ncbi:hypothetical protein CDD83_3111 [Cordyceps sp. RAO-2017]|nr:hypothetical protein CDD83_3111 [Cordyceps sp. RAO-2017]
MPRVFRGETTMLEHFRISGLLDEYYANGYGTKQTVIWVADLVKQLTDRNPHLNLLEIGAGTGGATKSILRAVGYDFSSYTFTDISSSFFENAAEAFAQWGDSVVFKTYNAEIDPLQQGFQAGAYDVVIAFMVIHACARLDEAMRNLRKLLKPGGLLILGEGAAGGAMQAGAGFIFGPLPGWWRGVDEGRTLSPLVDVSDWESILKRTGFSGIDTMSPSSLFDVFGITLIVSTAVDQRVDFIRNPVPAATAMGLRYKTVVILGGTSPPVARLVKTLAGILAPLSETVLNYDSLESMDGQSLVDPNTVVVSLTDLEQAVFQDITPERWYKFRCLFETERAILWLTRGRLEDNPFCNMTVGFGRSAVHEQENLRLQFLDVPDVSKVDARTIADTLLRFANESLYGQDILYTKEPEMLIDVEGCERVPRLFPVTEANDRINSVERPIFHQVDILDSVVELQRGQESCNLRALSRYETSQSLAPRCVSW